MANNYVSIMSNAIKTFNPQATSAIAEALAWGGLHETTVWHTKNDTTNILNMNKDARDASNAINVNTYNLTKCN